MTLSKNQLKLITSLSQKKYRTKHQLFIAEGIKVVEELINSPLTLHHLFYTDGYDASAIPNKTEVSNEELKKISNLKTPNKILALFEIPAEKAIEKNGLSVALDEINDPGNLGTIIRLCDWFGVKQLVCSKNTVDAYNQKVVQSTMGSLTRVNIIYIDLQLFLSESKLPIYIADMNGENIYKAQLPKDGILVMGNEANGISEEISSLNNNKITIPRFGDTQQTESLNVATATAILLNEFRRSL
jgi:TrmH family RNA methyltransferase